MGREVTHSPAPSIKALSWCQQHPRGFGVRNPPCGTCFSQPAGTGSPKLSIPPTLPCFRLVGREGGPSHGSRLLLAGRQQGRRWGRSRLGVWRGDECCGVFLGVFLSVFLPVGLFPGRRRHAAMAGAAAEERGWQGRHKMAATLRGERGPAWFGVGALPP